MIMKIVIIGNVHEKRFVEEMFHLQILISRVGRGIC